MCCWYLGGSPDPELSRSALAIKTIPYSEFLNLVKENRVAEVAISANQIQGKMKIDDKDPNKTDLFKTCA